MSKTGGDAEEGTYSRIEGLERIEEEREQSGSREPSMGGSEHQSDSDTRELEDEGKQDSIGTVSMGFNPLGTFQHVDSFNVILLELHAC